MAEWIAVFSCPPRFGYPSDLRRLASSLALAVAVAVGAAAGCTPASHSPAESATGSGIESGSTPAVEVPTDEKLRAQLDRQMRWTYANRHLSLEKHAAWQILHGALAFQTDFLVEDRSGEHVSAVKHVLDGGAMKGWLVEPVVDAESGHRGIRAILEAGSKTGQGHADQWFAVLAQCNLEPGQTIRIEDRNFTMADFVAQVQLDVPHNVQQEYSWTLIGLTTYLPTDATWIASDGQQWSIQRLMEIETRQCQQARGEAACGGTHRLIGMAMALNRHLAGADGGNRKLEGVWAEANEELQRAIADAQRYQNPDGSFSTRYLEGPGISPDLAQRLGTSGHVLELLAIAMTDQQLRQAWVERGVWSLCEVFEKTRDVPLECGALYHAAHGLLLYRQRMFGPLDFSS